MREESKSGPLAQQGAGSTGGAPTLDKYLASKTHLAEVLRNHWVTAMECTHDDSPSGGTDIVRCSCSQWTGTVQPTVGAAVEEWVQHVLSFMEEVRAASRVPSDTEKPNV